MLRCRHSSALLGVSMAKTRVSRPRTTKPAQSPSLLTTKQIEAIRTTRRGRSTRPPQSPSLLTAKEITAIRTTPRGRTKRPAQSPSLLTPAQVKQITG